MTEDDWKRLEFLSNLKALAESGREEYHNLLDRTEKEDEHPEWYNGPCWCRLCGGYAAGDTIYSK